MQFNVLALDARQQVVALTLEAANDTLAADQARAKGLTVVSVEAKGFRLGLPRRAVQPRARCQRSAAELQQTAAAYPLRVHTLSACYVLAQKPKASTQWAQWKSEGFFSIPP